MFDIGMGELVVIAIIAVLILGPERLPKAVAQAAGWLRTLRDMAANARREIVTAADLDPGITDDLRRSVQDLADLHPRRLASSILSDPDPVATGAGAVASTPPAVAPPVARPVDPAPGAAASFDPDAT